MLFALVTDKSRISVDIYEIPPNITFKDVRIDRVILNNNWNNITKNVWKLTIDNLEKEIIIPDGLYSELEYSSYLEQYLRANTDDIDWYVTYNKNRKVFTIRADNRSTLDVMVSPNSSARDSTGFPETVFYHENNASRDGTARPVFLPSYLTIRSSSLDRNGYAFKNQTSDIIAFIPLQSEGSNSVFQETVTFITNNSRTLTLNNQIDLKFFLDDKTQIENPIFALEMSFL